MRFFGSEGLAARAALAAFVLLTACSSEDSTESTPPPAPETLFDTLPAATPEKLRGVWQNTQTQTGGTIELRLRFTDGHLVGAAKCSTEGGPTVVAGGSVSLDTTALDAATGKVTFGTLGLRKDENMLRCEASIPGNAYDFTIADGNLTLSVGAAKLNTTFTKIGD